MHQPQKKLELVEGAPRIVGGSKAMKGVLEMVGTVARSDATVLIRGESGVGKELVADAIHHTSHRARGPFVKVNCAALASTVLESELFGHERGAFTGAFEQRARPLRARRAAARSSSTRSATSRRSTQIALLRVLQQQEFQRVGGSETVQVDVRIIAATNRDLEELMEQEQVPPGPLLPAQRRSRSTCRRCASGARTSSRSPTRSPRSTRARTAS